MKFLRYLRGYCRVKAREEKAAALLSLLMERKISFTPTKKAGDGLISFYTPYRFPEDAEPLCEEIHRRSFLSDLYRYRKRAGLALGFILAAALIFVSTLFVWDIRIVGAENTEEEEIFAALERHGFRIGAYIPSLDKERIAMEITKDDGRFSWFKINMRGTVATIDIHERTGRDSIEALTPPSNLIAACDAQIELLDVSGGATVVKIGQTVKRGELLVSGVIDSQALGYRLVRARGSVYGRTTLEYDVKIPVRYRQKLRSNTVLGEKSIIFFGKSIKVFKNDRISAEFYDIIERKTRVTLFGVPLPLYTAEKEYICYETREAQRTQTECLREAYAELTLKSSVDLDGAEVLARHTKLDFGEEYLTLHEQVDCIIDIAKEVKIGG